MTSPLPGTIGSNLPPAISLAPQDNLFGIQGGTTKRFSVSLITGFIGTATIVGNTEVTGAGDYHLLSTDQIVYLVGAHTRNVLLPPARTVLGHLFWIKVDANGVTNPQTIVPNGTDTIEGLASLALSGAYQWVLIYAQSPGLWLLFT